MELSERSDITSGYKERIRRIALFDPLYELGRKQVKDIEGFSVDMKGLGLLTLLFFFEQKVMRNFKVGTKDVQKFLQTTTERKYVLTESLWGDIASTIIKTFRPATGKKRDYVFQDWEAMQEGKIEYSLLKANNYDSRTNTQFYTLDEDGLELIFATKEFYSEFQLSINQLMLRKQLEKGEFRGALRQINEMVIDVESLKERIIKLRHEIQRSIVSEETFERYKQLLTDIHARLERENEEFTELRQFVNETKDRLYEKDYHQKESKTYAYILEITKQLEAVHYEHSGLLDQSIELKTQTLKAAQESLYYTGIDAFNFEQDINSRIIGTPLPLDVMKGVLHPFLHIHQEKSWSPFAIFAEQNIREDREEIQDYGFMELGDEKDSSYQLKLRKNYGYIMNHLLQALNEGAVRLSEVIDHVCEMGDGAILHQRFFYDFWMILHQRSPIVSGKINTEEDNQSHALDDALTLLGNRSLEIQERNEMIHSTDRFTIQDMDITMKEDQVDEL
jgi:hypothetical protein